MLSARRSLPRTMLVPGVLAAAGALVAWPALAETRAAAPAGGGLPGLEVRVDLARAAVVVNGANVPLPARVAAPEHRPGEGDVVVEAVAIGAGRQIVHVAVPSKDEEGIAWEGLFAGGQREPLFAGLTGFVAGDPGERTGKAVQIVEGAATSFVVVGDIREDVRVCGQPSTLLDPQALYPASLELRSATVQRLTPEQQAGAQRIVATDAGPHLAPALARLLVARGSSVPGSRGAELTDGDPATVWTEQRPRIGQGEFVVMAAPRDVPIARLQVVVSAPAPAKDAAAPRSFYLVTGSETFEVTLPGDGILKPGEAYEIALPHAVQTACLSLVLDDAYGRGLAHPDVGVAELVAYSELDAPGATLGAVAKRLSGDRGAIAAQVLERAGRDALEATRAAYGELDERGRALAMDVAASHPSCEQAAPLLVRGLCEPHGEAARKAREKLERCKGAAGALAAALHDDPAASACVAPTLVTVAGPRALEPLADAMAAASEADAVGRAALRSAFAAAMGDAPPGRLAALLQDGKRSPAARLEMVRAAGDRVTEAAAESDRVLADVLAGTPPLRARYLALGPLGRLARAGDRDAAARVAGLAAHDADWPVRARAAEVAAGLPDAAAALLAATHDAEPRVREAALQSLAASSAAGAAPGAPAAVPLAPGAVEAARAVLASDRWSFVKTQAVGVLAKAPPGGEVDGALRGAMHDEAARVRQAAVLAAGLRHAGALRDPIRELLDDATEDAEVRAAAARALGAVCDASSVDRLTALAHGVGVPGTTEDEQLICVGALTGLAALHPPDLQERLAPLLSKGASAEAKAAARQALAARGVCH